MQRFLLTAALLSMTSLLAGPALPQSSDTLHSVILPLVSDVAHRLGCPDIDVLDRVLKIEGANPKQCCRQALGLFSVQRWDHGNEDLRRDPYIVTCRREELVGSPRCRAAMAENAYRAISEYQSWRHIEEARLRRHYGAKAPAPNPYRVATIWFYPPVLQGRWRGDFPSPQAYVSALRSK
jgi:hypothetical protein